MDADRLRYLIDRYLTGSCTRQQMDELLNHIRQHGDDERLQDLLPDLSEVKPRYQTKAGLSWEALQREIKKTGDAVGRRSNAREAMSWPMAWWKVAACVALMAIAGGLLYVESNVRLLANNSPSLEKAVETTKDEHRLIVLPDGSKVWINGNSRIVTGGDFNQQMRRVTLYGEAFFDIRHDTERPFIIETGEVKTTVLGTAFNIRAFPDESTVIVTVARGKVLVEAENRRTGTLTANQQITLSLESDQVQETPVDASQVTQWIKDDLILYEVTLDEVEEILEEQYDIGIVFDHANLKGCRFTSTLTKGATLEEVLTAICMVNNATFTVDGKIVTLYGDGCKTTPSKTQ